MQFNRLIAERRAFYCFRWAAKAMSRASRVQPSRQRERQATMNPSYDFEGQVALVTGAASGMGLATSKAFAEAGAAVVLADFNKGGLDTATGALTSAGHQAIGITCDVSNEAQVAGMTDSAVAAFGRLDMTFNNAGIHVPP